LVNVDLFCVGPSINLDTRTIIATASGVTTRDTGCDES
jgi:hypothetical protein